MAKRILLVEDDPAVRTLVTKALAARAYEVSAAEDGLAGLKAVDSGTWDLLIVDIMMPKLDGMSLVRALKGHDGTKHVPVIFLTAKNDPRSMIEGINVGAKFYVTKPFQIDDLVKKVERALLSS